MSGAQRPNVLLIMQDQLRHDVVVDPDLCRTPTFDRLRAEGTWFDRHYTPLGICSPARAAMFTGLYPHSNGVFNNFNGTDQLARNMSRDHPTIAELLSKAGYRTGYVGKWHLGVDDHPGDRGFQDVRASDDAWYSDERFKTWREMFGEPDGQVVTTSYPPGGPRYQKRFRRQPFPMYATAPLPEDRIPAGIMAAEAAEMIRSFASGADPFFIVVSFIEPHWPNVLPEDWAAMYDSATVPLWANIADPFDGKARSNQAGLEHFGVADFTEEDWRPVIAHYLSAVSWLDHLTGQLVDSLDRSGAAERTLVIVTTDHGDMTGSHRQFNKGPLMYEEVYHVPFVARWPGTVTAGATVERLTGHLDVLPTVLELAGVERPEVLHGASLLPLLRGGIDGAADWREALMCEFHGDEFGLCSQRMIRRDRWKLVYNPNDLRELYDLEADPAELQNLAYRPEYAQLRVDLEANLLELMHDSGDTLRLWATNTLG